MSALAFEGVHARAGGREILAGVDLEVGRGEVVALVGPNGAGKTTLLRVASRVLPASQGGVRIEGRPLDALPRREVARAVAAVPQDASIPFPFTAGEIAVMGRAPHLGLLGFETAEDVALARAAMERLGIVHLADRSVLSLSGGERQLVLFARALTQAPRVLLLDEPTAHLDLRHRLAVLEEVRAFAAAGGSALVVSHDLGLAARTCDRAALLVAGRLTAVGAPAQVFHPDTLRAAFGVETELLTTPDGALAVVARRPT